MEVLTQKTGNNRFFLSVSGSLITKCLVVFLLIAILRTINIKRMQYYITRTREFINEDVQRKLINAEENFSLLKNSTIHFNGNNLHKLQGAGYPTNTQALFYEYVKGCIVNELGMPVANATITIRETGISALSGCNGEFRLARVCKRFTLVISCARYETLVVQPGNGNISVCLRYSNRRVMAGLDRVTIYTKSAPLILLNEQPLFHDIDKIKPEDVESITLLDKTRAAAIINKRAANGVINIITKAGKYL